LSANLSALYPGALAVLFPEAFTNTNYCVGGAYLLFGALWLPLALWVSVKLALEAPGVAPPEKDPRFEPFGSWAKRHLMIAAWTLLGMVTLPGFICALGVALVVLGAGFAEGLLGAGACRSRGR
jgi:hypothetical protein